MPKSPPPSAPALASDGLHRRAWLRRFGLGAAATIGVAGIGRELAFDGPILATESLPDGPIVDIHAHTAGLGALGSRNHVSAALRDGYKFSAYLRAFDITAEDLETKGDGIVVDKIAQLVAKSLHVHAAVVLALDGPVDDHGKLDLGRTQVYVDNDFVVDAVRPHAHLLFGASINPRRHDALDRLERAIEDGAKLVKWIPPILGIDPADSAFRSFYRRLADANIPLLTHGGQERSFTHSADELGDPDRLELALDLGVTVVIAHAAAHGGDDTGRYFPRTIALCRRYPNLYADISALTLVNRYGQLADVLWEPDLAGRLLYGSDHPLDNTPLCSPWHHPLRLRMAEMAHIAAFENPWDRDVLLKQALGVPASTFARTAQLLGFRSAAPS